VEWTLERLRVLAEGDVSMIQAGFAIENPHTGSRLVVIESDAETGGMGWVVESHNVPHAGPDVPEHLHLSWTERFEIIAGVAHYSIDGVQRTAGSGDVIVVHPNQRHIHPWNAGETELVYRQRTELAEPNAGAVQDVLGMIATVAGLAREGKVTADGRPKSLLQQAAMLKLFNRYGLYDTSLPTWLQDLLAATVGSLAEALGYKAVNPHDVGEPMARG